MLRELLRRVDMMVILENHLDALVRLHTPFPPGKIGGAYQPGLPHNLRPETFYGPNAGLTEVLIPAGYVDDGLRSGLRAQPGRHALRAGSLRHADDHSGARACPSRWCSGRSRVARTSSCGSPRPTRRRRSAAFRRRRSAPSLRERTQRMPTEGHGTCNSRPAAAAARSGLPAQRDQEGLGAVGVVRRRRRGADAEATGRCSGEGQSRRSWPSRSAPSAIYAVSSWDCRPGFSTRSRGRGNGRCARSCADVAVIERRYALQTLYAVERTEGEAVRIPEERLAAVQVGGDGDVGALALRGSVQARDGDEPPVGAVAAADMSSG